jgi:hypothetical protein
LRWAADDDPRDRRPSCADAEKEQSMLWALVAILVLLWLVGFAANIAGGLIHIVLVVAIIVLAYQFLTGRRTV